MTTTYLIVRVLGVSRGAGVNEGHIAIAVPERFGATPPEHNRGAMNVDYDACDISGYPLRNMLIGDLTTIDADLIW